MNYNPLNSFWFWLSFWGFSLAAVFGWAILRLVVPNELPDDDDPGFWQRVREFKIVNRPWYYVVPIWLVMATSIVSACEAFTARLYPMQPTVAVFVFSVGCSYAGAYLFARYGSGIPLNANLVRRVSNGIVIGLLMAAVVMGFLGFRLALKRNNDLTQQQITATKGQVKANLTISPKVQAAIDSLNQRATHTDSLIAESLIRQSRLDRKLDEVIDNTTPTNRRR